MAQVRRIIDNVLIDYPFSLTHQGIAGQVVVDDLGEGNQVYFKYGVNTDLTNDVAEIVTHISMADFYSLDLVSADPEGVNPDAPLPELEPTRIPIFPDLGTSDYKTYIDSGTYIHQTRIKLIISNNEENFDVEFSAYYHGSLSGTAGNYSPNTWVTIPRETDGTYYLILPSNDDTIATPQPFWARFVGNTPSQFGAYITYRTNGGDPFDESGGGTPPTVGTSDAVVRTDFDYCWTVWGGFTGRDLNRLNDKPASKTHYAEMSAMSASGTDTYKGQRPFYAYDIEPQQIDVPVPVQGSPFHINEPRYADTDWQMTADDMKMCNEYLIRSGFQCWNFTYYANTYQLAQMRTFWENLSSIDKRGIKAFYTIGQLGGSRGDYRVNGVIDPTNDYTINLNHIVTMMGESWYKKIDGRPVVVYFNPESETNQDLTNLREAYRAEYSVTDNYPFYEIYMTSLADTNHTFVYNNNLKARTWYYQTNGQSQDSHNIQTIIDDAYDNFVTIGNTYTVKDVCPSFTIALDNRCRNAYPGETACIDSLTNGSNPYWQSLNRGYVDKSYSYYNAATQSNINDIVSKSDALYDSYTTRMKLVLISTFDECSEGGLSVGIPKKRANGTINDDIIEWFRAQLNSGYVNP